MKIQYINKMHRTHKKYSVSIKWTVLLKILRMMLVKNITYK